MRDTNKKNDVRIAAIIPARMASSRFPGKPLLKIRGLPMVEHVRRRSLLCKLFSEVVVATCDTEIRDAVVHFGGRVIMTSPDHPAATDRVAEAVLSLECSHVVNVQGDEVLVLPKDLEVMTHAIQVSPEVQAWNAVARVQRSDELSDPSVVKCVVSRSGAVLFCSRDFSKLPVDVSRGYEPVRKILGILAYRCDFLREYSNLTRTPLERQEGIDQSRILEHDIRLQSVEFTRGYIGVNRAQEVEMVQVCLNEDPLQQAILHKILSKGRVMSRENSGMVPSSE